MNLQIYDDCIGHGMQTRNAARKMENQAQKRTALGKITNVNLRQQPARAVKGTGSQFTIYEDKENISKKNDKLTEEVKTKSKRTALGVYCESTLLSDEFQPEANLVCESPMLLDVSCMDTSEQALTSHVETDRDSLLYCLPEYQDDIHDYLREAELRFRPKANYMRKQTDISSQMRTILVDWLVEVGEEYKLHDETLHLAVNYIDRFLSQMAVLRGKLQLVGTACMFLASKFEEIYPPDVGEFVYITDDTYTKKQLLRMEHLVVKVLGFDIAVPTANVFTDLYCRQLKANEQLKCMTQYITELSLHDCDNFLEYSPSMIASSALFLAAHIVEAPSLSQIEKVTRYQQFDVAACVQKLLEMLRKAPEQPQQAVREKYKSDSKRSVASLPIPELC